jgi:hypothetical protein
MITSGTEKELSGAWQRERERALKDSTGVDTTGKYGLTNLNITTEGLGINDPDTYKIDNTPVDTASIAKSNKVDLRNRPECGD